MRFELLLITLTASFLLAGAKAQAASPLDYVIFDTYPLAGEYIYSETKAENPSWVENLNGKIPVCTEPAYTPGSSIGIHYVSNIGGKWQAKLLHRKIRGQDEWDNGVFIQPKPTPFKKPEILHAQIYRNGVSNEALPQISLLTSDDKVSTSLSLDKYLAAPDQDGWSQLRIPISDFRGIEVKVAEQVKGIVLEQGQIDGKDHQIYLDQIDLRPAKDVSLAASVKPENVSAKGFERHVDVSWKNVKNDSIQGTIIERSSDGVHFTPVGFAPNWISRYADWVGLPPAKYSYRVRFIGYDDQRSPYSAPCSASTRILSDDELLDMVQEACARYYYEGPEENSGLALESVPGDPHMIATGASGFGIMSLVVAAHRGYIPREQVAERMLKILAFLQRQDHFHGAMAHYYDGSSGHQQIFFGPDDDGGDLVETSFIMQGLLTARQFFDQENDPREKRIREQISKLWENVEWNWYRQTPDSHYLYWHWSPDVGWKINHRLIGWNETMITYLLSIASPTHPIPAEMYYSGYASQEKLAQEYRGNAAGKMYSNGDTYYGKKLWVGGFSGGPIFFTHYNFMGLDPHGLRDRYTDYFENSKSIVEINLRYCQANPQHHFGYGSDGWGLTASDDPWAYNPDEARPEGDKGKLTPTGAIASMPYLPAPAMAALKNYYRNYGSFLWGPYGFRDAFSLDSHWVNDLYMGLNQGPMVVMIENYRSGTPWKLFGSIPEIKRMRKIVFGPSSAN